MRLPDLNYKLNPDDQLIEIINYSQYDTPVLKKSTGAVSCVQMSNVTVMEIEEACGELKNIDVDEGRCKSCFRVVVSFACPPPFVGNEVLIKKGGAYSFICKYAPRLSVDYRLESF